MTYNPTWIKGTEVVKRDGSNTLFNDWDVGDKKRIIIDELRMKDSDGFVISDSTGTPALSIENVEGKLSLRTGVGVNEISNDSTSSLTTQLLTAYAIHQIVSGTVSNAIKGGVLSLNMGDTTAAVNFGSAEPDTNYLISTELVNTTDSPTSIYAKIITSKTTAGFVVEFSDFIDSTNYTLEWTILRVS